MTLKQPEILTVDLGERSYPIVVGQALLDNSRWLEKSIRGNRVAIVTNTTVAPHYLTPLRSALSNYQVSVCELPDGEQYKNLDTLNKIYDHLLESRCGRDVTLLALGGGVVGDMTGYAAASYQRGVDFVQIPTTLLAQVDSSVGGKTGVNHRLGKNMIGAFYQPQSVLIDIDTLATLPDREFSAGMAEVIKCGFIEDAEFLRWLADNMGQLMQRDVEALRYAIIKSCECKARVVAQDEREAGLRAILNFGHTFGHAIETATGYDTWLHGEAVGFGMIMALDFSHAMGLIDNQQRELGCAIIAAANLPQSPPAEVDSAQTMIQLMGLDKKVSAGRLRLVLLNRLGQAFVTSDEIDSQLLFHSIEQSLKR